MNENGMLPPAFFAGSKSNSPAALKHAQANSAGRPSESGDYDGSLKCNKCYAKHLSKALVEITEYFEDMSRYDELSLFLGDVACAEDHASALGKDDEKGKLHEIRTRAWDGDPMIRKTLQELARNATMEAMSIHRWELREAAKKMNMKADATDGGKEEKPEEKPA